MPGFEVANLRPSILPDPGPDDPDGGSVRTPSASSTSPDRAGHRCAHRHPVDGATSPAAASGIDSGDMRTIQARSPSKGGPDLDLLQHPPVARGALQENLGTTRL